MGSGVGVGSSLRTGVGVEDEGESILVERPADFSGAVTADGRTGPRSVPI